MNNNTKHIILRTLSIVKYQLSIALLVLFASCSTDNVSDIVSTSNDVISFSATLPAASAPTTYALNNVSENAIREIDALVFCKTATDDEPLYLYKTHAYDITNATDAVNGNKKNFKLRLALADEYHPAGDYYFLFIANARSIVDTATLAVGATMDEIKHHLIFSNAEYLKILTENASNVYLPMSAQTYTAIQYTEADGAKQNMLAVYFLRSHARINLYIGESGAGLSNFELTRVGYFLASNGYVAPFSSANIVNNSVTQPSATALTAASATQSAGIDTDISNVMEGRIYVPETTNDNSRYLTTTIFLAGKYNGSSTETYYRLDITNANGKLLPVLRNHSYSITIKAITTEGLPNVAAAFMGQPTNIISELKVTDDFDITDYLYDGANYLGRDKKVPSKYSYWQIADTIKFKYNVDNYNTSYSPFSANVIQGADWLSVNTLETANGYKKIEYKFSQNDDVALRNAVVKIQNGYFTVYDTIRQRAAILDIGQGQTANCYTWFPVDSVDNFDYFAFRCDVMGNGDQSLIATTGCPTSTAIAPTTLVQLWTDNDGLISDLGMKTMADGKTYAVFKLADVSKIGNTVLQAKAADGTSLWCWHLWNAGEINDVTLSNGYTLLDRNIGATGLTGTESTIVYQYAWPYPFCPSNLVSSSGVAVTPEQRMLNPNVPLSYGAWNGQNKLGWGYNSTKTIYDPCPAGYRVLTVAGTIDTAHLPISGVPFEYTTDGGLFEGKLFMPNVKSVIGYGGTRSNIGSFVDASSAFWTNAPSNSYGYDYSIRNKNKPYFYHNLIAHHTSFGYPVRCVKE